MKVEYVNPFIDATISTFKTMCNVTPCRNGQLDIRQGGFIGTNSIMGVIGLTGKLRGSVVMTMDIELALKVVGAFIMEEIPEANSDLMDGFGEILNIIAGEAAAKLEGFKIGLSLPTVLMGDGQRIYANESAPWVIIPLKIPDWGEFSIDVSMEEV